MLIATEVEKLAFYKNLEKLGKKQAGKIGESFRNELTAGGDPKMGFAHLVKLSAEGNEYGKVNYRAELVKAIGEPAVLTLEVKAAETVVGPATPKLLVQDNPHATPELIAKSQKVFNQLAFGLVKDLLS